MRISFSVPSLPKQHFSGFSAFTTVIKVACLATLALQGKSADPWAVFMKSISRDDLVKLPDACQDPGLMLLNNPLDLRSAIGEDKKVYREKFIQAVNDKDATFQLALASAYGNLLDLELYSMMRLSQNYLTLCSDSFSGSCPLSSTQVLSQAIKENFLPAKFFFEKEIAIEKLQPFSNNNFPLGDYYYGIALYREAALQKDHEGKLKACAYLYRSSMLRVVFLDEEIARPAETVVLDLFDCALLPQMRKGLFMAVLVCKDKNAYQTFVGNLPKIPDRLLDCLFANIS